MTLLGLQVLLSKESCSMLLLADNLDTKFINVQLIKTQQVKLHLNPGDLRCIKPVKTVKSLHSPKK